MPVRFGLSSASVAAVLAAWLAVAHVAGQQPAPAFKTGVEIVVLDVSVVDKTGLPVGNLAPDDFVVTVDGKPRVTASAQFLRYESRATTTAERSTPPTTVPAAAPAPPPPPRLVLIAIDEDSVETGDGLAVKEAAAKFLDQFGPNDRVGVVRIPRLPAEILVSSRRADAMKQLDAVSTGGNRGPYEFNIGLAEAFDVEKGYYDVAYRVIERECGRFTANVPDCAQRVRDEIRQMQIQERLRAQRALDALAGIGDALASVEGPKTVVLISGGMPMPDLKSREAFDRLEASFASAQATLYTLFMERSSVFGQVRNRPSPTATEDDTLERFGIENATSVTGGTLMLGIGTVDQYFDRVVTELSGSYLLGVEVAASDGDGRAHLVDVKVKGRDIEVRARKRYVIEPARAARPGAAVKRDAGRNARPSVPPPITIEMMTPEVEAAVARAGAYATAYETELSGLVSEERYVQRVFKYRRTTVTYARSTGNFGRNSAVEEQGEWVLDAERELKSDFLLVKAKGSDNWLPFRDVIEVDGKKVREREERLQRLFLEAPATAAERAREITAESARYNIGFVERNVNLPTLALRYLDAAHRSGLLFRKQGQAAVSGVRTWELGFMERASPTIVRDGAKDIPATGAFWIDPLDGRVVRSVVRFEVEGVSIEITVTYRQDAKSLTFAPAEMREVYTTTARRLECQATYSRIRRFQVTTDEAQKEG